MMTGGSPISGNLHIIVAVVQRAPVSIATFYWNRGSAHTPIVVLDCMSVTRLNYLPGRIPICFQFFRLESEKVALYSAGIFRFW